MFSGRLNRRGLLVGVVCLWLLEYAATIPTYIMLFTSGSLGDLATASARDVDLAIASNFFSFSTPSYIYWALSLVVLISGIGVFVRRLHDMGRGPVLAIILAVTTAYPTVFGVFAYNFSPDVLKIHAGSVFFTDSVIGILNLGLLLFLLLSRGVPGPNRYGEVPPEKQKVAEVLLG